MIAVDTNILVYAIDVSEPAKMAIADRLLKDLGSQGKGVLLWQVACEFLACLHRWQDSGRITAAQTTTYFQSVAGLYPLVTPDPSVLATAISIRRRYSLSHWDSLLIAACLASSVNELYSEDLSHGANYDGVKVSNPFLP